MCIRPAAAAAASAAAAAAAAATSGSAPASPAPPLTPAQIRRESGEKRERPICAADEEAEALAA
eukprot:609303-Prymnesium_polylepis.1